MLLWHDDAASPCAQGGPANIAGARLAPADALSPIKLYISIIPPLFIGFFVGVMAAIMGVGGGFIMVPAMIYILRMPTNVVIGTSLFQIIFVTAAVTILHAVENQTVDIVLAVLLMIGGVVGAQIGARVGQKLPGEQLRALLALIVLGVGMRLLLDLVLMPDELYSLTRLGLGK